MESMEKERMDRKLYSSLFYMRAKQIPLEILDADEKPIILKCINQEEATLDEIQQLKAILGRYRRVIEDYDIEKIEENFDTTQKIIKSEKELLKLIDNEENYKLRMRYWHNGEEYIIHLLVKPLKDSQAIFEMQNHLELFKDCTVEERVLLDKTNRGATLSEEEYRMLEHLNTKLEEKLYTQENIIKAWNEFLARQVDFENSELTTINEKIAFWEKIDISTKSSLYNKVRNILKLDETFDDDLFLDG